MNEVWQIFNSIANPYVKVKIYNELFLFRKTNIGKRQQNRIKTISQIS